MRTPSPATLTESEEDIAAPSEEKDKNSNHAGDTEFLQPHLVACIDDEVGEGCSSPKSPDSNNVQCITSTAGDSDSEYHPSQSDSDANSAQTLTSADDETELDEESSATSSDDSLPGSYSPKILRSYKKDLSRSTLAKHQKSNSDEVCYFLGY